MRIGIDVRYLSHGLLGGVHTYLANLLPELIKLAGDDQIYLYADTKRPLELVEIPPHVTVRLLKWRNPISSIRNDFAIRRQMARDGLDVVHFPANCGIGPANVATVITLHDAINVLPIYEILRGHPKRPRVMATMVYLHYWTLASVRRADVILTVSNYAKHEIVRYTALPTERVVPISHAPTADLGRVTDTQILETVRVRHGLPEAFVLADALKNPQTVIGAWRRLPREMRANRRIVFFSRSPTPPAIVAEAVAAGDAQLLVRPSRSDLIALYSMADAFVFPSWIEGFGLPVLEAMVCGAPVVASDRGAIPEVAGGAALLADAHDEVGFARHLANLLSSSWLAATLREKGHQRATSLTWTTVAAETLQQYGVAVDCAQGQTHELLAHEQG